jgi:hypothetical protein
MHTMLRIFESTSAVISNYGVHMCRTTILVDQLCLHYFHYLGARPLAGTLLQAGRTYSCVLSSSIACGRKSNNSSPFLSARNDQATYYRSLLAAKFRYAATTPPHPPGLKNRGATPCPLMVKILSTDLTLVLYSTRFCG